MINRQKIKKLFSKKEYKQYVIIEKYFVEC